jgi:serine/threonine-protein kinase
MRLVEGRTLAAILDGSPAPGPDRRRLLPVLLQVAQTVAYAHAHGVVHGDLTPSNVMLGRFGEVQVMDWGLARVVPAGEDAGDEGRAVGVMGTPGYLAPERLDGTAPPPGPGVDVFAMGSILCEVITGRPAYEVDRSGRAPRPSPRADTSDALTRLAGCGADDELVELVHDCLSVDPSGRPADAGAMASRLSVYLDGVAERLREAELARVEDETHAREEAKRRRLVVLLLVLASALFGAAALGLAERLMRRPADANERTHSHPSLLEAPENTHA